MNTPDTTNFAPYSEIGTKKTVLQKMGESSSSEEAQIKSQKRAEYFEQVLDQLAKDEHQDREEIRKNTSSAAEAVIETLERKGGVFLHTPEYYAAIQERSERMRAYQGISVSNHAPSGEEAEIQKNPFQFLCLPEGATYGQARAAWLRLARIWHQDLMRPEDPERFKLIFGQEKFVIDGANPDIWAAALTSTPPPEKKSIQEIANMNEAEKNEYQAAMTAYAQKEKEYEKVKQAMVTRAHEKLRTINSAFEVISTKFSPEVTNTIAGFKWEKNSNKLYEEMGIDLENLALEGGAELRKYGEFGGRKDERIMLSYDMGDIYMSGSNDYRQSSDIRAFFAWIELVQMNEISPLLLVDITKTYELNYDQVEQLRCMLSNREDAEFIVKALRPNPNVEAQHALFGFIDEVYRGPTYTHNVISREYRSYAAGVEVTEDGGMVLRYENQHDHYDWYAHRDQTRFTPADMQVMRAVAYGPLLGGSR